MELTSHHVSADHMPSTHISSLQSLSAIHATKQKLAVMQSM